MAWMIRPVLPTGTTFDGQLLYNITEYEIESVFKKYIESVEFEVMPQFETKITGFTKKKYRKTNSSTIRISIMLVGNLPFWIHQLILGLAIGCNGAGITIDFRDTFCSATVDTPVTYNCRWLNAGDFVENSELINGGSIDLVAYTLPEDEGRWYGGEPDGGYYEKVISAPASGLEWTLQIADGDADYFYTRVTG